ncbi:Putative ubiquitin interacting, tyrosyl-DNA phosphodiesterase I [Septoria linicola]|uniref:Ubiquitin interacting, tyrosyl-DNA phosphodiesterase I n=1 Tax=Septoria linicola TaxID=215465 RepID=A0A9Q9AX02_9PEZI|nr:putative ubiquitin interacting, tyrosyl-DNA phosphodiesterase I [Septoria linicola]USW53487.1 Putative ubiquitin interacting, tyrosyl-DNA phosphodiesterase I [Septoria linicola]
MTDHSSDDEELKAAIAMSLSEQQEDHAAVEPTKAPSSLLGLDRKAMEAERLARMAKKRPRSISPPPIRDSRKAPKLYAKPDPAAGTTAEKLSASVRAEQQTRKSINAQAAIEHMRNSPAHVKDDLHPASISRPGSIQYPRGVIKRTWAFGHERDGNDIKLEEVLEPLSVRTAVLSAFQWDVQWVLSKLKTPLNGGSTKCIFVMQAKEPADRDKWREDAGDMRHFLRLCFPSMSGLINCMHSKLMLLFHPAKLRIAVPTANLLNFDWGETGQMENSVFMIDLPRLPDEQKAKADDLTLFGKELMFFIEKQGFDQDVRDGLLNFDFSATAGMAFVHTVGGVHHKDQAARTGLLGLSRAVRELGLATTSRLEIDFAASSIGSLNDKQLIDLHMAARGVDMLAYARDARSKAGNEFFKKKSKAPAVNSNVREQTRIYFPTKDTVRGSTAGAAGTICLQRQYYEKTGFPQECFRDYKSTRPGLLSHNKILCARGLSIDKPKDRDKSASGSNDSDKSAGSAQVSWLYIGSSNMSQSAWGQLPAEKLENKITCRNWECGVLLPVPTSVGAAQKAARPKQRDANGDSDTEDEDEPLPVPAAPALAGMNVFDGIVSLPFHVPGDAYNGREPWYFTEQN